MLHQIGDKTTRYSLFTEGENPLRWIGLNPSTANTEKLDPTSRNIDQISRELGYDSWRLYNLYPLRATKPKDLPKRVDKKLFLKNLALLELHLLANKNPVVVCWGNFIGKRGYLREASEIILSWLEEEGIPVKCLHINQTGEPVHPSPQGLIGVGRLKWSSMQLLYYRRGFRRE